MMQKSTITICLTIMIMAIIFVTVNGNLILKSNGKKHSDIVMIGDKCQPTIIKSGDKKGKNSDTVIMNPECHHKEKKEYIAYPVYHEYPSIIHEYHTGYGYGHGYGGGGGGSSHGNDYGHQSYGHNNNHHYGQSHQNYEHQYGNYHGMMMDPGYGDYYRRK
ncbi:uncharacterized protein LOC113788447 [Dermatophagoides pteronyssinus]|uniref:uncharacterized protein LOC113788447 n=1 Tax=Dermatophagoides pteronyssinus TaxID=6956 RepID=UPI003F6697E9